MTVPLTEKFIRFCASDLGKEVLDKEAQYLYQELKGYKRILDIGCGIGVFEERLPQLNITGLDQAEAMLEEAKKRSDKRFILGDAEKLEFSDEAFDAVFFVTTLEFISDYKKAIGEAARVLAPKGKLVVMLLNPESEYFKTHEQKEGSYFRKIKWTNFQEIEDCITQFFSVRGEYFLGIKDKKVFDSNDPKYASLYILKGIKR